MPDSDLKKELIACIESTNDKDLLSLLKEDLVFYGKIRDVDITDGLQEDQLNELKVLSEEDQEDTITLQEFKDATKQWRIK